MSRSRLFLALWPDEAVGKSISQLAAGVLPACGGRVVPAGKLHLTLAFLGDVEPVRRAALLAALGEVRPIEGLLQLDRLAYWPPGIVWLGPREAPDFLLQHAAELRTVLDREGVSYDRKVFKPHITLLRQVGRARSLPEPLPLVWPVAGFRLVESCPDEAGAPYRVLGRFE